MENGPHVAPQDAREQMLFATERGPPRIAGFRRGELEKLGDKARRLLPALRELRSTLMLDRRETRPRPHSPLLRELLRDFDVVGT